MKRVEQRLEEEKKRVRLYLNETTEEILMRKCEEVLIKKNIELFCNEFQNLLKDGKNEGFIISLKIIFFFSVIYIFISINRLGTNL
jgi:hypothetical protein